MSFMSIVRLYRIKLQRNLSGLEFLHLIATRFMTTCWRILFFSVWDCFVAWWRWTAQFCRWSCKVNIASVFLFLIVGTILLNLCLLRWNLRPWWHRIEFEIVDLIVYEMDFLLSLLSLKWTGLLLANFWWAHAVSNWERHSVATLLWGCCKLRFKFLLHV